jgi:hypothetical protein
MTICIGALCESSKVCVVAADREITVPALSLEFEHHEGKIEQFGDHCVVMSSGDALLASEVIKKTRARIGATDSPTIHQAAEILRDVYMSNHLERAERVILHPRGYTLKEFKERGAQQILSQIYLNIDNLLFNFGIGAVEFLIAGIDNTGAHIFRVHYSGVAGGNWLEWCDKLGYRAIGSGLSHASISLSIEGQHQGLGIPDTLYNVYSAKKSAELAPGVGRETDLAIITADGLELVSHEILKKLEHLRVECKKAHKIEQAKLESLYEPRTKPK